ncbi:MAG: hypothetical protein SGCHY_004614, partial [Lobulomycetales sp.]
MSTGSQQDSMKATEELVNDSISGMLKQMERELSLDKQLQGLGQACMEVCRKHDLLAPSSQKLAQQAGELNEL